MYSPRHWHSLNYSATVAHSTVYLLVHKGAMPGSLASDKEPTFHSPRCASGSSSGGLPSSASAVGASVGDHVGTSEGCCDDVSLAFVTACTSPALSDTDSVSTCTEVVARAAVTFSARSASDAASDAPGLVDVELTASVGADSACWATIASVVLLLASAASAVGASVMTGVGVGSSAGASVGDHVGTSEGCCVTSALGIRVILQMHTNGLGGSAFVARVQLPKLKGRVSGWRVRTRA